MFALRVCVCARYFLFWIARSFYPPITYKIQIKLNPWLLFELNIFFSTGYPYWIFTMRRYVHITYLEHNLCITTPKNSYRLAYTRQGINIIHSIKFINTCSIPSLLIYKSCCVNSQIISIKWIESLIFQRNVIITCRACFLKSPAKLRNEIDQAFDILHINAHSSPDYNLYQIIWFSSDWISTKCHRYFSES